METYKGLTWDDDKIVISALLEKIKILSFEITNLRDRLNVLEGKEHEAV
jgi:hypothetical protein